MAARQSGHAPNTNGVLQVSAPQPAPRQRRKEARPGELLAAALDVFVERGFAAARLDEIAQRAGVSKGTLYLYFESKEALLRAVVQESMVPLIAEGEDLAAQAASDPAATLQHLVTRWWREIGSTKLGGIPKLVMAEAGNFPEVAQFFFENVVLRGQALFRRVAETGIAQGVFRPCEPMLICDLAIKPLIFNHMWCQSFAHCDTAAIDPEVYLQAHLDVLLNGLLTHPHPTSPLPEHPKK